MASATGPHGLTSTEILVLEMVLAGLSSKQIAHRMHRSTRTIEVHRQHIMEKLQAKCLVHLVLRAVSLGLGQGQPAFIEQSSFAPMQVPAYQQQNT